MSARKRRSYKDATLSQFRSFRELCRRGGYAAAARELIAAAAQRAVARAGLRPPAISLPATLEVDMQTADMAEVASWVRGADRTGVRTVRITGADPMAMFRSFVAVTYITRVAEGR